jgi:hypothetical protein
LARAGILIYVWTRYRVSYVFIFEFNPRDRLTHFQVFEEASSLLFAISSSMSILAGLHAVDRVPGQLASPCVALRESHWPQRRVRSEDLQSCSQTLRVLFAVSRLIYPFSLFVFFLFKLFVPFKPFSHW